MLKSDRFAGTSFCLLGILCLGSILQFLPGQDPIQGQTRPLGTIRPAPAVGIECPSGHTCRGFEVTCPGVSEPATGVLGIAAPTASPRGLIMLFGGGAGDGWVVETKEMTAWEDGLRADGFMTVQVSWLDPWLYAAKGENVGTHVLACRPATVVKWVHDVDYLALGAPSLATGRCGFCITGNSGGSSQVSYTLSHYGLEGILDAVVPTGGPVHAALVKTCLHRPGEQDYWYPDPANGFIDRARGFYGGGPCRHHEASFTSAWNDEAVDTGGADYLHDKTRIHFILGKRDGKSIHSHATDYADKLNSSGSPMVTVQVVEHLGHRIMRSNEGREALAAALTA